MVFCVIIWGSHDKKIWSLFSKPIEYHFQPSLLIVWLIGASSTYQISKFTYVFIHAVGWPALLYKATKTMRAAPAKNWLCWLSVWETPPNCRRFHDNLYQAQLSGCSALPESGRQSLPTLTAHQEPLPFSELAETLSARFSQFLDAWFSLDNFFSSNATVMQSCQQVVKEAKCSKQTKV